MEFTNKTWVYDRTFNRFVCDASDLNRPPGVPPSPNTVRDPWGQRALIFTAQRNTENEITRWEVTMKAPDETWITLVIYND